MNIRNLTDDEATIRAIVTGWGDLAIPMLRFEQRLEEMGYHRVAIAQAMLVVASRILSRRTNPAVALACHNFAVENIRRLFPRDAACFDFALDQHREGELN